MNKLNNKDYAILKSIGVGSTVEKRWSDPINGLAFGVDVSGIQKVIDYKLLKKSGVQFMIARCSHGKWTYNNPADPSVAVDTMFAKHCQGAWDADMVFGAYTVFDPTVLPDPADPYKDKQIAAVIAALKYKKVGFLAVDIEIWKDAAGKDVDAFHISEYSGQMVARLLDIFPFPIGVYTGKWFVDQYAPPMKVWMDNLKIKYPDRFFVWDASYPYDPDAPAGTVMAQWSDFRGIYSPEWPVGKSFPWISAFESDCWQFTGDKYKCPGHYGEVAGGYSAIDGNFFRKTETQLRGWCDMPEHGEIVTPEPDPTTNPVGRIWTVAAPRVNIRLTPGLSGVDVGDILKGQTLQEAGLSPVEVDGITWHSLIVWAAEAQGGNVLIK